MHTTQECVQQRMSGKVEKRYGPAHFIVSRTILSLVMAVWMVPIASAVEKGSATEAVKLTVDQVLVILGDESLKQPGKEQQRLKRLEETIGELFDYEEMGKRTMGRHWKALNPSQQQEFTSLFRKFLSNTYAGNVEGYSGEQVDYVKERRKGQFAEVQTIVVSKKLQIPLDYRLLNKSGQWRVYDVVIDGVSLVKNFRGQFNRIIKSSSYEGLLDKLRTKTAKNINS